MFKPKIANIKSAHYISAKYSLEDSYKHTILIYRPLKLYSSNNLKYKNKKEYSPENQAESKINKNDLPNKYKKSNDIPQKFRF